MSEEDHYCKVEFFFDYSSPWTYLAYVRLKKLLREYDDQQGINLEVDYRPILVGAIFNSVNPSVYEMRKAPVIPKAKYSYLDLEEWCVALGINIRHPYGSNPPSVFPVNSAKALRGGLYALKRRRMVEYSDIVFEEYWVHGKDISDTNVLGMIATKAGFDAEEFLTYITKNKEAKEVLRQNTNELMERGGFGSPTMFVGNNMYFGNDRIPLLQRKIDQQLCVSNSTCLDGSGVHKWVWPSSAKTATLPSAAAMSGATARHVRVMRVFDSISKVATHDSLLDAFTPSAVVTRYYASPEDQVVVPLQWLKDLRSQASKYVVTDQTHLFGESWVVERHKIMFSNNSVTHVCILAHVDGEGYIDRVDVFHDSNSRL